MIASPRAISQRAASACERAEPGSRCRCRCHGEFHGAARLQQDADLALLPPTDPHHAEPPRRPKSHRVQVGEQLAFPPLPSRPVWLRVVG